MERTMRFGAVLVGFAMLGVGCGGGGPLNADGGGPGGAGGSNAGTGTGGVIGPGSAGGSSGGGAACKASPCGGNIVGTWALTQACPLETSVPPDSPCPTETIDTSGYHVEETVTFKSDGTYAAAVNASGSYRFTIPPECLPATELTCAERDTLLQELIAAGSSSISSGSCQSLASGACQCTESYSPGLQGNYGGTYATSGTSVTTTPTTGTATEPSTNNYCVVNDLLYLASSDGMWIQFVRQ